MITDQKERLPTMIGEPETLAHPAEQTAEENTLLQYVSYELAHTVPESELILADCHYPRGLVLTHLYEERVPDAVRSNTSTEAAIKAIQWSLTRGRTRVTCNHWDIDGFLAVWALLNPEKAIEYQQILIAAAMLGDFREFDQNSKIGLTALKICSLLNRVESTEFCLPFGDLEDATIEYEVAAQKFEFFLIRFAEWLDNIDSYESIWLPEYTRVLSDLKYIRSGSVQIREIEPLGLSIVRTPHPIHYYSICSSIRGGAVLTFLEARPYAEFEYRYETRVGRLDKKTILRRELSQLAQRLTDLEAEPGITWTFDNILLGGPMLRPEIADSPLSREECYQSMEYRLARHPNLRTGIPFDTIVSLIVEQLGGQTP